MALSREGQGRITRKVDPLLDGHDRRHRKPVDLESGVGLTTGDHRLTFDIDALDPAHYRPTQGVGHSDSHLVPTGIGRFVAEEDEIEPAISGLEFFGPGDEGGSRRLRVPIGSVGRQQYRLVCAHRHGIAKLFLGLRRAEGHHDHGPAVLLLDTDRLLDGALLVRAGRERQVSSVDRLSIVGEDDAGTRSRDPLDADEGPHPFIRASSGSNSGVEPATATFTG